MKTIVLITIFSISLSFNLFSQDINSYKNIFIKGNKDYNLGNYNKALTKYKLLEQKGVKSASLYYNIGNCYVKLKKYGMGTLYYEKALSIDPNHINSISNLKLITAKNVDKILNHKGKVEMVGVNAIYTYLKSLDPLIILTIFIISWLLLWSVLVGKKLNITFFKTSLQTFLAVIFSIMVIFSLFFIGGKFYVDNYIKLGIVIKKEISAKPGPDSSFPTSFMIHEGLKVKITDQKGEWYEITLPNGNIGWVHKSDFKQI